MYVQGLALKYGAEEKKNIQNALIKRGWFMYIALVLVRYSLEIQEKKTLKNITEVWGVTETTP